MVQRKQLTRSSSQEAREEMGTGAQSYKQRGKSEAVSVSRTLNMYSTYTYIQYTEYFKFLTKTRPRAAKSAETPGRRKAT